MGMQTLTVELAVVKAWQTFCAMSGQAGNQQQLRGRLQRYLNRRYTVDSTSRLFIDGLAFLERSSPRRSGEAAVGFRLIPAIFIAYLRPVQLFEASARNGSGRRSVA